MKKLLLTLDDETFNLLAKEKNKSQTIRDSIKIYKSDISTDTIQGFRAAFVLIKEQLKEIDSKIDYLAKGSPRISPPTQKKESPKIIIPDEVNEAFK